ncbi:MAG: 50S ribosomal protein L29 [Candidatus Pacebacteria bacterium]|jgi:ribosomal protein L29|nr:50S ribosomal protein L29 [Candidatus Paceibacterota bacterium]
MSMTKMEDIRKKSEAELASMVEGGRKTVREERFKDKWGRKASTVRNAKLEIARALTELSARRRNPQTK